MKQKIRRLQNEISQRSNSQSAAIENVKDASVIITNPTHFAVAIKYEVGEEGAPVILALGRGMIAEKIIKSAESGNTPLLSAIKFFIVLLSGVTNLTDDKIIDLSEVLLNSNFA